MNFPIPPGPATSCPTRCASFARSSRPALILRGGGLRRGQARPTVEYEDVLRQGDDSAAGAGWRLFDEHGKLLVLRSDMTIPIARMVATRFPTTRARCASVTAAQAYRSVTRGSGQPREFLQAGAELIGVPGVEGDAEVVALVLQALTRPGCAVTASGVGDGALYRRLLRGARGGPELTRRADRLPHARATWRA